MINISWERSAEWRVAQALALGRNVDIYASQALSESDICALSLPVRKKLLGKCETYNASGYGSAAYLPADDLIVFNGGTNGYPTIRFKRDSDGPLSAAEVEEMMNEAVAGLEKLVANIRLQREEEVEKLRKDVEHFISYPEQVLRIDKERRIVSKTTEPYRDIPGRLQDAVFSVPQLRERYNAAWNVAFNRITKLEQDFEKQEEEEKEKREKEVSKWIEDYGSQYLKLLYKEGFPWENLYFKERICLEHPSWRLMENTELAVINLVVEESPPMTALGLLEEARKTVENCRLVELSVRHRNDNESLGWGVVTAADAKSQDIQQFEWVYEKMINSDGEMVNVPEYPKKGE